MNQNQEASMKKVKVLNKNNKLKKPFLKKMGNQIRMILHL